MAGFYSTIHANNPRDFAHNINSSLSLSGSSLKVVEEEQWVFRTQNHPRSDSDSDFYIH